MDEPGQGPRPGPGPGFSYVRKVEEPEPSCVFVKSDRSKGAIVNRKEQCPSSDQISLSQARPTCLFQVPTDVSAPVPTIESSKGSPDMDRPGLPSSSALMDSVIPTGNTERMRANQHRRCLLSVRPQKKMMNLRGCLLRPQSEINADYLRIMTAPRETEIIQQLDKHSTKLVQIRNKVNKKKRL